MATTVKKAATKLSAIKKRLRANQLTASDVKQLGKIIANVEKAAKDLRAAVVE
jgi:DNA anti-recombination protein RmuC